MPKVTVLLPVYNAQHYIGACIESILQQSEPDFELLIINDGSTDQTVAICETFTDSRIRLEHNPGNRGITYTLNRGIELAKAPLIARMDADDLALPNRLASQVAYMEKYPYIGGVSSWFYPIDQNGSAIKYESESPSEAEYIAWALLFKNPISHPAVMFRTQLAKAAGGYGTEETYAEDYHLWSKMHDTHPIHVLPKKLIQYRVHANNVSNQNSLKQGFHACKIAQSNISRFLGQPVSFDSVRILFYASQGFQSDYPPAHLEEALRLLETMHQRFLEKNSVTAAIRRHMQHDVQRMLYSMLLAFPLGQRLGLLASDPFVRSMSNAPLWLNALHNWKKTAKMLLNKPQSPVISPLPDSFVGQLQRSAV